MRSRYASAVLVAAAVSVAGCGSAGGPRASSAAKRYEASALPAAMAEPTPGSHNVFTLYARSQSPPFSPSTVMSGLYSIEATAHSITFILTRCGYTWYPRRRAVEVRGPLTYARVCSITGCSPATRSSPYLVAWDWATSRWSFTLMSDARPTRPL